MVFSSSLFIICFLPLFLACYYAVPSRFKNAVILLFSTVFYAWGAPRFLFVLFGSIVLDFYLAKLIGAAAHQRKKKMLVTVSVILNVSVLLYFKYANFFVENVNALLISLGVEQVGWVKVALPIGISFFTFHELSYVIDVYRGVKPPLKKIGDYALYILLFPQLVAGPIIRFHEISDQIGDRKRQLHTDGILLGFFRFATGLAKKVLVANTLGLEADLVFALPPGELTFAVSWLGALAYTFQIYFDFSGYSDMAIGLGRMMGFIFPENFNNPYISQSITEFWRRWHISLSRWMRDYLYIPLGGNRVSPPRMYVNLWLVFLVSGLWHGAQWTFLLWGAYHGAFLVLEKLFMDRLLNRVFKAVRMLYSFFVVVIGWVLFRAETLSQACDFLGRMFTIDPASFYFSPDKSFLAMLAFAAIACFMAAFPRIEKAELQLLAFRNSVPRILFYFLCTVVLLVLSVSYLASGDFNPFIYYRF